MLIPVYHSWLPRVHAAPQVFELWEAPPASGGAGGTAGGAASAPRHYVRVLYNREELQIPHCPPGASPTLLYTPFTLPLMGIRYVVV